MAHLTTSGRKKVAIIGSGAAGIGALWALNRTHHDVYLYEADDRLGGHTNTVDFVNGKFKAAVDTGFIVLNSATYPNFIEFLKVLKVPTVPTDMTFGISRDYGILEWAGTSLGAIFAQRKNIFSPRMWRMILDTIRFNLFALDLLQDKDEGHVYVNGDGRSRGNGQTPSLQLQPTIAEYLDQEGYSDAFRDDYIIPITAAVWSTSPDKCSLDLPVATLVRFMWNHQLLSTVAARPAWLTIQNGSKSYVDAVMKGFPPNHIFLNSPVAAVTNDSHGKVQVQLQSGTTEIYDHVILATHGDTALKLISSTATAVEKSIMSNFQTSQTTAILHSDTSLMPKRRTAWSAWNYMTLSSPPPLPSIAARSGTIDQVSLTYNMNMLQQIPISIFGNVFVTINPLHLPPPELVQGRYTYNHPIHTAAALRSQSLLHQIQNKRAISYCGGWTKHGLHEDAFSSGLKVAVDHLGAKLPFEFRDAGVSTGRAPVLGIPDLLLRIAILVVHICFLLAARAWGLLGYGRRGGAVGRVERMGINGAAKN